MNKGLGILFKDAYRFAMDCSRSLPFNWIFDNLQLIVFHSYCVIHLIASRPYNLKLYCQWIQTLISKDASCCFSTWDRISRGRPKPKVFNKTSGVLKLKNDHKYKISVMAVYNHSNHSLESVESKALEFSAFQDSTSSRVGWCFRVCVLANVKVCCVPMCHCYLASKPTLLYKVK